TRTGLVQVLVRVVQVLLVLLVLLVLVRVLVLVQVEQAWQVQGPRGRSAIHRRLAVLARPAAGQAVPARAAASRTCSAPLSKSSPAPYRRWNTKRSPSGWTKTATRRSSFCLR